MLGEGDRMASDTSGTTKTGENCGVSIDALNPITEMLGRGTAVSYKSSRGGSYLLVEEPDPPRGGTIQHHLLLSGIRHQDAQFFGAADTAAIRVAFQNPPTKTSVSRAPGPLRFLFQCNGVLEKSGRD